MSYIGPTDDSTQYIPPPPDPTGYSDMPGPTADNGPNSDPTDLSNSTAAIAGPTSDDTTPTDDSQKKTNPYDPTDLSGGTDASNMQQAAAPVPTSDPTDLSGNQSTGYSDYVPPDTYNDYFAGDDTPNVFPNAPDLVHLRQVQDAIGTDQNNLNQAAPDLVHERNLRDAIATDWNNLNQVAPLADLSGGTDQSNINQADPWSLPDPYAVDAYATDQSNLNQVGRPTQPGNFVPDVPLDTSQVIDLRGMYGPFRPDTGFTPPTGTGYGMIGNPTPDPTDLTAFADAGGTGMGTGLPGTPDYPQQSSYSGQQVGRGEQAIQSTGTTPDQSGAIANAGAAYLTSQYGDENAAVSGYQTEGASLMGEQTDLGNRWQAYLDAVNSGQQERDPQFEASIQGEASDLQGRVGEYQSRTLTAPPSDATNQAATAYQDAINQVAGQQQAQAQNQYQTDATNLTDYSNIAAAGQQEALQNYLTSPSYDLSNLNQAAGEVSTDAPLPDSRDPAAVRAAFEQKYPNSGATAVLYDANGNPNDLAGEYLSRVAAQMDQAQAAQNMAHPEQVPDLSPLEMKILQSPLSPYHVDTIAGVPVPTGLINILGLSSGVEGLLTGGVKVAVGKAVEDYLVEGKNNMLGQFAGTVTGVNPFNAIPDNTLLAHPGGAVVDAVQRIKSDPTGFVTAVKNTVMDLATNWGAWPQAAGSVGDAITQAITQDPTTAARQAGYQALIPNEDPLVGNSGRLQAAAVLTTMLVGDMQQPTTGVSNIDPFRTFDRYQTAAQQAMSQGVPATQAYQDAFNKTAQGWAELVWNFNPNNPAFQSLETPFLENFIKEKLQIGVRGQRAYDEYLANAGLINSQLNRLDPVSQLMGTLSKESGVKFTSDALARGVQTAIPKMSEDPAAVQDALRQITDMLTVRAQSGLVPDSAYQRFLDTYGSLIPGIPTVRGMRTIVSTIGDGLYANALKTGIAPDVLAQGLAKRVDGYFNVGSLSGTLADQVNKGLTDTANDLLHTPFTGEVPRFAALKELTGLMNTGLRAQYGLPAYDNPNLAMKAIGNFMAGLRSAMITPAAFSLSLRKLTDEGARNAAQGIYGLNPADFGITRFMGAPGAELRKSGAIGQAITQNVPIPRRIEAIAQTRNPFQRITNTLVGETTRHAVSSAFSAGVNRFLDRALPVHQADLIAALTHAGASPEELARAAEIAAPGKSALGYNQRASELTPRLPSTAGQSRFTPSARVTQAMNETGGTPGFVQQVIDGHTAPSWEDVRAHLDSTRNPKNTGSVGGGMGQPISDIAAGDGGAGYLSTQQRGIRDDLNAMGGFGTGRTLDYGTPRGTPRTGKQGALDQAAGVRRGAILDDLKATGSLDRTLATIDPTNLDAIKLNQVAANTEIKYAQSELARGVHAGNEAAVYRDLAEMDRFANRLAEMRAAIDPAYTSDRLAQEHFGAPAFNAGDAIKARLDALGITPSGGMPGPRQMGKSLDYVRHDYVSPEQQAAHDAALYAQSHAAPADPTDLAAGNSGGFRPVQRQSYTALAAPAGIGGNGQALADVYRQFGHQRQSLNFGASQAGIQLVNRAIGELGAHSPVGEKIAQWVYPFSDFHFNSTAINALNMAGHPILPVIASNYLAQNQDPITGNLPVFGSFLSNLDRYYTGASMLSWANDYGKYIGQVGTSGNNPFQQALKIGVQPFMGNNPLVAAPFDVLNRPLEVGVAKATNPVLDAKGRPVYRDQVLANEAFGGLSGLARIGADQLPANLPFRVQQGIRDKVAPFLGNPAGSVLAPLTDATTWAVNQLPGKQVDLKSKNALAELPFRATDLAGQLGWSDPARTKNAVTDITRTNGKPATADGVQLLRQLQYEQDQGMASGGLPSKFSDANAPPQGAPVFAQSTPTELAAHYRAQDYQQRAGGGGKDAGIGLISKAGNYYLESPAEAQYKTARADIAKGTPVTPESVPFMDYNRDFLQQTGGNPNPYSPRPGQDSGRISQIMDAQDLSLSRSIAGNAQRTGAGLPQDARMAQIAKEEILQTPIGNGSTAQDLLGQPGNYYDTLNKINAATDPATKLQLERALASIRDADVAQVPGLADYFAALHTASVAKGVADGTLNPDGSKVNLFYNGLTQPQKDAYDAFNNLRSSADYKAYTALTAAEATAYASSKADGNAWYKANLTELNRLKGIIGGAEQSIVTRFGVNPRELANQAAIAAGRPAPYANTAITAPSASGTSTSTSSKKPFTPYTAAQKAAYGRSLGGSSSSNATAQAVAGRTAFNTVFTGLTKAEQAAAYKDPEIAGVLVKGARPTAAEWTAATTALKDLVRNGPATSSKSGTASAYAQPGAARYEPTFFSLTQADIDAYRRGILTPHAAGLAGGGLPGSVPTSVTSARAATTSTRPKSTVAGKGPGGTYTAQQQANYNAIKAGLPGSAPKKKAA